jgi:hypothetical protein
MSLLQLASHIAAPPSSWVPCSICRQPLAHSQAHSHTTTQCSSLLPGMPAQPASHRRSFHTIAVPESSREFVGFQEQLAAHGLQATGAWRVQNEALWARHALCAATMAAFFPAPPTSRESERESGCSLHPFVATALSPLAGSTAGTAPHPTASAASTACCGAESSGASLPTMNRGTTPGCTAESGHDRDGGEADTATATATANATANAATHSPPSSQLHSHAPAAAGTTRTQDATNARLLFHSTSGSLAAVCDEGLDLRLARPGLFGRGLYFTDNPAKALTYGTTGTLLACRVLLGRVCEFPPGTHEQCLVREPPGFDSVCGTVRDAREYVVYAPERIYVAYVLQCSSLPCQPGTPTPAAAPTMTAHALAQRVLADQLRRALTTRRGFLSTPSAASRAAITVVNTIDMYRLNVINKRTMVSRTATALAPGILSASTWSLFLKNSLHTVAEIIDALRGSTDTRAPMLTLVESGRVLLGLLSILPQPAQLTAGPASTAHACIASPTAVTSPALHTPAIATAADVPKPASLMHIDDEATASAALTAATLPTHALLGVSQTTPLGITAAGVSPDSSIDRKRKWDVACCTTPA